MHFSFHPRPTYCSNINHVFDIVPIIPIFWKILDNLIHPVSIATLHEMELDKENPTNLKSDIISDPIICAENLEHHANVGSNYP
jgi:hypothetical protein